MSTETEHVLIGRIAGLLDLERAHFPQDAVWQTLLGVEEWIHTFNERIHDSLRAKVITPDLARYLSSPDSKAKLPEAPAPAPVATTTTADDGIPLEDLEEKNCIACSGSVWKDEEWINDGNNPWCTDCWKRALDMVASSHEPGWWEGVEWDEIPVDGDRALVGIRDETGEPVYADELEDEVQALVPVHCPECKTDQFMEPDHNPEANLYCSQCAAVIPRPPVPHHHHGDDGPCEKESCVGFTPCNCDGEAPAGIGSSGAEEE